MGFYASGPRPPGMPSPAPTNKNGAGCPPGWKSPYGLVSGYPVAPNGDVLPWGTFCTKYPFACPPDWAAKLKERVHKVRSRTSWPAGFYGPGIGPFPAAPAPTPPQPFRPPQAAPYVAPRPYQPPPTYRPPPTYPSPIPQPGQSRRRYQPPSIPVGAGDDCGDEP